MMLSVSRAALLLCILFMPPTFASAESSRTGGTIHFTGQVVESLCETATDLRHRQMEMRCQRNGVESVNSWPLASLTGQGARSPLAAMNIRYLDPQRKLAILTVSYN